MSAAPAPALLSEQLDKAPRTESDRHCSIGTRRVGSETRAAIWSARKSAQVFKQAGAVCPLHPRGYLSQNDGEKVR